MPRSERPAAIASIEACRIPAPAPWAKTKHARAFSGRISSADTAPALPTVIFSSCAALIGLPAATTRRLRPDIVVTNDLAPEGQLLRKERVELAGAGEYQRHHLGLAQLCSRRRLAEDLADLLRQFLGHFSGHALGRKHAP